MQVRPRAWNLGDVVTVRSGMCHFPLPSGLPEHSRVLVIGREPGRVLVHASGKEWNLAVQCVDHGWEYLLNGVWLDENDRRVRKALAAEERGRERRRPTGRADSARQV